MKFRFVKKLAILGVVGALVFGGSFSVPVIEVQAAEIEWTDEDEEFVQNALQEFIDAGWSAEDLKNVEETIRGSRKNAKKAGLLDNSSSTSEGYNPNVESSAETANVNETATDDGVNVGTDNESSSSTITDNEPSSSTETNNEPSSSTETNNEPSSNTATDNEPSSAVTDNEQSTGTDNDSSAGTETDGEPSSSAVVNPNLDDVDPNTGRTVAELLRTASVTAELKDDVVTVVVKPKYNDTVIQSYSLYSNDKNTSFPSVAVSDNKFTCEMPEGYSGTYFIIVETSEGTLHSNNFGVLNEAHNEVDNKTGNGSETNAISSSTEYTEGSFTINLKGVPEICNEGDTVVITINTDIPVKLEFNGVVVGRGIYSTSFDVAVSSNGTYEYKAVNENNEEVTGSIEVTCFQAVEEASSNIGIIIAVVVIILIAVIIVLLVLSRKRIKKGAEENEITEEDL